MKCLLQYLTAATLLLTGISLPISSQAFRNVALGTEVPDVRLKSIDGKKRNLFEYSKKVTVFLFFRPNQKYSQTTLKMLSRLCSRYSKRGVHCAAIVSDYYKKPTINSAIKAAGWSAATTFIDKEDLFSDRLGLVLYPAVGIVDRSRKLQAYEPFVKVNYAQRIEAEIRFLLGDISKKQLQSALAPSLHDDGQNDRDTARLNYNFAKKLYEAGEKEKALIRAERALSLDPKLADAYALIGTIYATEGRCSEANANFHKALEIDKKNKLATKGMNRCK